MTRRPPRATRSDTLFPYTTLIRSKGSSLFAAGEERMSVWVGSCRSLEPSPREGGGRWRPYSAALRNPTATPAFAGATAGSGRSEEHTSELQSLMRISYAVFCLRKKKRKKEY